MSNFKGLGLWDGIMGWNIKSVCLPGTPNWKVPLMEEDNNTQQHSQKYKIRMNIGKSNRK